DGSFTYTPTKDFFGTDTFTYHAFDGVNSSNIATVTITVTAAVNDDAPVADADAYTVAEETLLTVPAGTGVLLGDTDPDGAGGLTAVLDANVTPVPPAPAADRSFPPH